MFEALLFIIVGAFIGWNLPQPEYAKKIQEFVVKQFEEFRK